LCDILETTPAELTPVIDRFRQPGRTFLMPLMAEPMTYGIGFDATIPPDADSASKASPPPPATDTPVRPDTVSGKLKPETVIDISHESLMRVWLSLRKWVEEEAESARIYRRLAESARLHSEGREGLLQDPALQLTLDWRNRAKPNPAWGERYAAGFKQAMDFLDRSRDARVLRRLIIIASALVFFGILTYAFSQRAKAIARGRITLSDRLAGRAERALSLRPHDEALRFASEAIRQSTTDAAESSCGGPSSPGRS
jgi:hypothetical protein